MKKRILALSMAAVTALTSTSIVAFADNENSEALAAAITLAKSRIDIPEELTEFTYSVSNQNLKTVFYLTWSTPRSTALYKSADVTVCGDLILSYRAPTDWSKDNSNHFAKLTIGVGFLCLVLNLLTVFIRTGQEHDIIALHW